VEEKSPHERLGGVNEIHRGRAFVTIKEVRPISIEFERCESVESP
jgi:hypothetical protein